MKQGSSILTPLVIVGSGGHGREVLDVVEALNRSGLVFEFLGFLDDADGDQEALSRRSVKVIGRVDDLGRIRVRYVVGIGAPSVRRHIDSVATSAGVEPATLIHPLASVGSDVELGPGAILAAGARITTNVRTGRHVHLNVSATVAHDCRLGNYVSLSPGSHLSGSVTLEDGAFLGTGAVVRPGCTIGADAVVGAGAVVVHDVAPGTTVAGVPATTIK